MLSMTISELCPEDVFDGGFEQLVQFIEIATGQMQSRDIRTVDMEMIAVAALKDDLCVELPPRGLH